MIEPIEPKELRIGSKLFGSSFDNMLSAEEIIEVREIDGNFHQVKDLHNSNFDFADLSGIPLTLERFKQCGIEINQISDNTYSINNNKLVLNYNPFKSIFVLKLYQGFQQFINIKYVHQLQNIYFIVNGVELQIRF